MDLSYRTWEWDCKSLFSWSTLFLDKDMQVNTEGGLQKIKQNVLYGRNGIGSGCHLTPYCTERLHPTTFSFCHFLSSFIEKRQHTDRLQRINNIEKMNKREGKPKYFHPSKKTFSLLSWQANCERFCSLCSKKVLSFFRFDMRGAVRWTCRTKSDSDDYWPGTPPCCEHSVPIISLWPRCSALTANFTRNRKHILYSTNFYAYFTIYFYYHFNKYKTTLWFKRKQWVLKRH